MVIRETIHHGDYFNVRTIEGSSARELLASMGETSPYPFTFDPEHNRFHAEALEDLEGTGKTTIGWARYEVTALPPEVEQEVRRILRSELQRRRAARPKATTPRPIGRPPIGTPVQVRLPDELVAWVDAQADAAGVKRAAFIRDLLEGARPAEEADRR
jgi:hypothetical protein